MIIMYRENIRDKVNEILKGLFTPEEYVIHFGYDCVNIELYNQIYTSTIREFEDYFGTDSTLIYAMNVNGKGNIVLMYDVSEFIIEEYGSWSVYEEKYGYVGE